MGTAHQYSNRIAQKAQGMHSNILVRLVGVS